MKETRRERFIRKARKYLARAERAERLGAPYAGFLRGKAAFYWDLVKTDPGEKWIRWETVGARSGR